MMMLLERYRHDLPSQVTIRLVSPVPGSARRRAGNDVFSSAPIRRHSIRPEVWVSLNVARLVSAILFFIRN
jgi:hypothetical protein